MRLSRAACGKMACIRAQEQVPSGKAEGTGCPSSPWPTQHIKTPAWGRARTGQHSGRPALSSCGSGDVCEEGRHSPRQEPGRRRRGAALLGQGQRGPGVRHPAVAGRPTPGVSGGGWEADRPPSAVKRSWSGLEGPSRAWTSARRHPLFLRRGVVGHQLDPESRCDRPRVLQELPAAPRTGRKGPGQRRRRPRPRGERHRLRPVHRAPTPEPQEQSEGSPGSGGRGSGVRGAAALRDSAAPARRGNPPAARKPPENVSGATAPPASPHTAASTPALQGPRQGCPPVPRSRPRPDGHSGRLGEPRRAQPPEAGGRRCSEPAHPGGVSVCSRGPRWRGRKQRPAAGGGLPPSSCEPPAPPWRPRACAERRFRPVRSTPGPGTMLWARVHPAPGPSGRSLGTGRSTEHGRFLSSPGLGVQCGRSPVDSSQVQCPPRPQAGPATPAEDPPPAHGRTQRPGAAVGGRGRRGTRTARGWTLLRGGWPPVASGLRDRRWRAGKGEGSFVHSMWSLCCPLPSTPPRPPGRRGAASPTRPGLSGLTPSWWPVTASADWSWTGARLAAGPGTRRLRDSGSWLWAGLAPSRERVVRCRVEQLHSATTELGGPGPGRAARGGVPAAGLGLHSPSQPPSVQLRAGAGPPGCGCRVRLGGQAHSCRRSGK